MLMVRKIIKNNKENTKREIFPLDFLFSSAIEYILVFIREELVKVDNKETSLYTYSHLFLLTYFHKLLCLVYWKV